MAAIGLAAIHLIAILLILLSAHLLPIGWRQGGGLATMCFMALSRRMSPTMLFLVVVVISSLLPRSAFDLV